MKLARAKISQYEIKKIIKCFCLDINASKTAKLLGINRNTINHWFMIFRKAIYVHQMTEFQKIFGEAEIDESYFGARRRRGFRGKLKRGRGTQKQPVFGILKRDGRIYTEIIPNCKKRTLQAIIKGKLINPQLSIPMAGAVTTALWMSAMTSISGLITDKMNLPKEVVFISTALRIFGVLPREDWQSSMALNHILNCI